MLVTQNLAAEMATYKKEVRQVMEVILRYWMQHAVDEAAGGFVGRIDGANNIHPQA